MTTTEQDLKRVLHYGLDISHYQPGDRENSDVYFSCVQETIKNIITEGKITNPVNTIIKVFSDGYSVHPEMLVLALAVCAKQNLNIEIKEAAYKAVKTICSTSENFFLFIKYYVKVSQKNSISGSGFRKVCKDWYLKKDVKTLAEMVGRHKKLHGWSHKDIIKLIHLKTAEEPARAAIIRYLLFGIKSAKKDSGDNAEANEVLNYLQSIEDFKRLTDPNEASRHIEIHKYTLEHVPPHLVKSQEVWSALVETMPLNVLLKNLERVGCMGFLKENSHFVEKVTDALLNKSSTEFNVHPAEVYVALSSYKSNSKFLAAEIGINKRRKESGQPRKKCEAPPAPNENIINALQKLFFCACKVYLAPTGLRYSVVLSVFSPRVGYVSCDRCHHVQAVQAASLISLCLLHADRNVSVRVNSYCNISGSGKLVKVDLTTEMSVEEGVKKIQEAMPVTGLNYSLPLESALSSKEEYDVFVFVVDEPSKINNTLISSFEKYRNEMKIPNAKLVVVVLRSSSKMVWPKQLKNLGIFVIEGFDENVPRLIEAFSRGAF